MKYFLNPIGIDTEGFDFVDFVNASIVFIAFIILLGIAVYFWKKTGMLKSLYL